MYKAGTSQANRYLVMYVLENQCGRNRLGISVSKKVGNSVVRHRTYQEIESALLHLAGRHRVLWGKSNVEEVSD